MRFWPSKRRWKHLAIGAAIVVAVLLIVNAVFAWRTERRLQAKLAEIRAAGDPASIAELAPEPIPNDVNAAAHLAAMAPRLEEFAKEHAAFFSSPIGKEYDKTRDAGQAPTPEQLAAIETILDNYPDLDANISRMAELEQYASQADFSLDPTPFIDATLQAAQTVRTAARFIDWRMQVLTADGSSDQAVERGIELLRISRLYESEPALVHYLVAIAMRGIAAEALYDALASGPVTAELHAALDEELAQHDDPQRLVRALRLERAFTASFAAGGGLDTSSPQRHFFLMRVLGWPVTSLYIAPLDAWDGLLPLAARPWHEVHDQFSMGATGHGVLADLLMPALQAAINANARSLATTRALRVFNALVEYRQQHGREASGLEDLLLPREATIDPYSGEPLKLKLTDDGWVIYSVMENGVNDGGDFTDRKDWGLAPRGWPR